MRLELARHEGRTRTMRGMVQEGGSALRRIGAYSALFGALAYLILAPAPAHAAASGPRDLEAPEVETAGRPEIGENLTCYPGSWEGSGVTFTYEWQREGAPLASGQTHQITAADEGHWLSCVVRATDGEGATEASSKDSFFINPPDKGPPKGGTISGRVTDAASATAISGVKACAENTNSTGPWVCVHTSTNGQYTMTVAEAGNYIVQFTVPPKSAYIASTYYNGAYASSEATVLPIAAGTTTTGIDAQLQEGGGTTGILTSASTGAPVQAVEVCARAAPGECALTNARGDYSISGLATGSYNVEFGFGYGGSLGETYVAPEYYKGLLFPSFLSSEATPVAVTAGATVEAINAEMHEWGKLSGRVTSASTHMPIPGIEVSAYNGSRTRTVTNANGEYLISHLGSRSGEYQVAFWPYSGVGLNYFPQWYSGKEKELESNPVHVPLDRTTSDIDAELIEGGQITGRVTNAATKAPVDEIAVCARSKTLYEGRCASTGTNGEYAITGLPSDEYEVSFYTNSETYFPQYYNGKSSVFEGQKVAVTAGHGTSGVDAELEKVEDGVIMGNVADKLSIAAIKGIEVCAYELGSDEAFAEELSADCATTNANGEYRITGLTGSQYLIEFYSPAGSGLNYATQFYSERASPLRAEVVRVTQGEYTPGINGRLELAGKLAGKVTAAGSGQPIKGIEVCVFTRGEELVGCLLSNAGGEYLTPPVARGEYKVEFVSPLNSGLNFVPEFYDGSSDWNNAQVVTVAAEATSSDVNAELQEGGRISGQVTNAWTSAPIKGAEVCAISESKEISGCAITGATGGYTIAGLPNGGDRVALGAGKGYIVQYYNDATSLSGAQTVSVTVGGTHEGIDAALEPSSATLPSNTSLPIVTGSPAVGDVLSCSSGSWTGSPTPTVSYAWL